MLPADVWVAELSTSFSDATFRLLTGVPKGDRSLELGEVLAADPDEVTTAIEDHPDVRTLERLHSDAHRAISQYEVGEQGLYEFLRESSLPPEFPLVVEDGEMEFDVTATRDQFEAFGDALDASDRQYELLTVVQVEEGDALLTERQRECVAAALREGYFEVPRDCTLAELADSLDVDKSTASETVRRGTARIVEQFLVGRR
ncbi:helix-turn-helix domain-containing protein [Halobacterium wangiae]|uniref:helix-turn-helix domain-containing protein n=1 Tax=Halobacterium wangiae TaxID=2902623 RepID=UPI001E49B0FF|nr:helix-turn-helix domain-containing protein [Halobacterium wangiae]